MNEKEEGLFGVWNEVHILLIWLILICGIVFVLDERDKTNNLKKKIKNLEKKVEESLDKEPITVKMEGSWEQFGKLTFNDSVLTKDD